MTKVLKMREIKFRRWDVCLERYYSWEELQVYSMEDVFDNNDEFCLNISPIEQYTGVKDINGKEIYEGDVVKRINPINEYEPETIGVVTYDSDAMFVIGDADTFETFPEGITFEVIGNIHENPDLLKPQE